jgi:hypothetical protein
MRSPNPNNVSSFWNRDEHVGDLLTLIRGPRCQRTWPTLLWPWLGQSHIHWVGKEQRTSKRSLKSLASVKRRKWPPPRSFLPPSLPSPFLCNVCVFSIKLCEKTVIGGWGIVSTAARTRLVFWKKISKENFCKSLAKCCTFDVKLEEGRNPLLCFWFSYPPHKWVSGSGWSFLESWDFWLKNQKSKRVILMFLCLILYIENKLVYGFRFAVEVWDFLVIDWLIEESLSSFRITLVCGRVGLVLTFLEMHATSWAPDRAMQ